MLSVSRCREILGRSCSLNDEELARLRDEFYELARVVVAGCEDGVIKSGAEPGRFDAALKMVPQVDRDRVVERASIRQFEGGQMQEMAERGALLEFVSDGSRR
jgi:hypothetical protein